MQNCPLLRHSRALFRLTAAVLLSVVLPWAAAAQQDAGDSFPSDKLPH